MNPFDFQILFDEEIKNPQPWKFIYLKRRPDVQVPIKFEPDFECAKMVIGSLGIGYAMGCFLALLMNAGDNAILDNTLSHKTQAKIYFRDIGSRMHRQGKGFGIFGAVILSYQCPLERARGTKDTVNGFIGGSLAGAMMAIARRAKIRSVMTGAMGTGLFIGGIDFLLFDSFH